MSLPVASGIPGIHRLPLGDPSPWILVFWVHGAPDAPLDVGQETPVYGPRLPLSVLAFNYLLTELLLGMPDLCTRRGKC